MMRGCRGASGSPRRLQALAVLLSITATLGLKQTVQLYRKNASLDSNPQRRLTNVLYYGTMQLGTPGQEITICPDTGSAAIWTSADTTPPAASGNSKIAPAYNGFVSNASSSYQLVSYGFAEKYNSGGIIGVLASDKVQLGDIAIGNASLGLVTEASVDLMGASCAGVLGLGRPGLAIRPGTAIFYRMLGEQGLLDAPSFSLWLDPDPAAEPAGSLTFGGIDTTRYTGVLTNVSVISSKYWMVPLLGVQAGGVSLPITARGAILDSSSAFSLVTDKDFLIFESLPGVSYSRQTGSFQVIGGCANITILPNLTVTLGSRNFTLTPQNYVIQVSGNACALGFQPGAPDNTVVLGTGFLRAYFTAYTYNATSRSSYVSLAPAASGNSTAARRRIQEDLGGYPGAAGPTAAGNATPPQPASASSAALSADALGGAADQDALLAATLAAQTAASAPTPAPAVATTAADSPAEASPPSASAAPAPAPETASVPAPTPPPYVAPATQGINSTNAELFPELVPSPPMQPPAPALAAASVPVSTPPPYVAPAKQGINNTNAELFPELVPSPPVQPSAPAPAPEAAPTQAAPPTEPPAAAPAPEAVTSAAASAPAAASGPAAAGPLPASLPIPVIPVAALEAPAPAPVAAQPEQAPVEAPAPGPASAPLAAPAAAPEAQPAEVATPVTPLPAAPAPAPAEQLASFGALAPAEAGPLETNSLAAPTLAPAPSAEPADMAIPVIPLTTAPLSAPAPAPDAAAVAAVAAPGPGMEPASLPVPAPAPALVPSMQPANIIIPVTMLSAAPVSAPAPARAAARAIAAAPAPARAATGPVSAFSLRPPTRAAAPARAPGRAPAPAPSRAVFPEAAVSGAGAPQPGALKRPVKGPVLAPRGAPMRAPAMAPAASKKRAAAPAPAPIRSAAPAQAPAASAAVGAAAAPAVMPNSIAPVLAPAPAPLAAAPMSARSPLGTLIPTGAGNASDVQPPFQAISGLEVLYGGLGSLWRLPLQLSGPNDTLFSSYLAAHPLTARQNRTLAKPRPPTPPGFGQPVSLVKLTDFMDTCVVGWSSVDSCVAKGLNGTTCALMPIFDDVGTVPYQCPFKNETQVQVPAGSGNFVPINQQWLLVRPGPRGQQIYNTGLGKCLDICNDKAAPSLCGHAGNVYLQDCDSTSATQQWQLNSVALANATVGSALNRGDLAAYQISNAYVPPVATQAFGAAPLNQTCIDTCEAERDAQIMPSAYKETTCNDLLPTYPSSATAFPCNSQRLPHSIAQGFAIVFAPQPQSA